MEALLGPSKREKRRLLNTPELAKKKKQRKVKGGFWEL